MKKRIKHIKTSRHCLFAGLITLLILTSCKKLVEPPAPVTTVNGANVFNTDITAISILNGIYINMSQGGYQTSGDGGDITTTSLYAGLSADELNLYQASIPSNSLLLYYQNALSGNPNTGAGSAFWGISYSRIFTCNAAIEGLNSATKLTPAVKQQLLAEAMFMRAMYYFYLVNYYGDVPLALTSNYKDNSTLARTAYATVYQQIISDLTDAEQNLSPNFLDGTLLNSSADRFRPTKWAAAALLARVYLYTKDWKDAEIQATQVINNSSLFTLSTLSNAFLIASQGNNEAIWQLQPVSNSPTNTEDGAFFILPSAGPNGTNYAYLSDDMINSFEAGDQRKNNWIDSVNAGGIAYYYPFKYKDPGNGTPVTEATTLLRLGEVLLIRAEARAEQNNIGGAQSDINAIRTRAGLPNTSAGDQATLLTAIMNERRHELFTEQGHRWLDLKRTGTVDAVMTSATAKKGGSWHSYQQLYPLPETDILADHGLVQNPGY